jgi:hypothetical protein
MLKIFFTMSSLWVHIESFALPSYVGNTQY